MTAGERRRAARLDLAAKMTTVAADAAGKAAGALADVPGGEPMRLSLAHQSAALREEAARLDAVRLWLAAGGGAL